MEQKKIRLSDAFKLRSIRSGAPYRIRDFERRFSTICLTPFVLSLPQGSDFTFYRPSAHVISGEGSAQAKIVSLHI
jgi:hypothetical protein